MAKVVIKKRPDAVCNLQGLVFSDYETTVDGVEIDKITSLKLEMGTEIVNTCTMTFLVDDVEVDAEFLAALQAHIESKKE